MRSLLREQHLIEDTCSTEMARCFFFPSPTILITLGPLTRLALPHDSIPRIEIIEYYWSPGRVFLVRRRTGVPINQLRSHRYAWRSDVSAANELWN